MEDFVIVNFYDWFQEISTSYLLAIMPFNAIVLKNHFKGLCILGLGIRHYAEMSQALMDFLLYIISPTVCIAACFSVPFNTVNKTSI